MPSFTVIILFQDRSSRAKVQKAIEAIVKDENLKETKLSSKFVTRTMKVYETKEIKRSNAGFKSKVALFFKSFFG